MKIETDLLLEAWRNSTHDFCDFRRQMGITLKQWKRMRQTSKVKVSPATARKVRVMALDNSPYKHALIKMIDAQEKK